MRTGSRLIALVLIISITACSTVQQRLPNVEADVCGACPDPAEVYTEDGEHPIELLTEYWNIDAQACVYATLVGDYTQPVLCPQPVDDPAESVSAFVATFTCEDCGCTDGVCPLPTTEPTTDTTGTTGTTDTSDTPDRTDPTGTVVVANVIVEFAKFIGALTKVAGVAKLYCVVKAALKAAKTAATAISKARGHRTQLNALLATYPNVAQRTPAIIGQIQGEAWRASANYARSLAAARLSLKKGAEAIAIMTAAWAGGNYLLGSKEEDEKAKKEIEDGMKDAEDTLKTAHGEVLNEALPADVKVTQRGRFNRAIEETQRMIDELNKLAMTRALCDDEKELKAVLEQQKEALVKERDALGGGK